MINKAAQTKVTTASGAVIALLGYLLSPEFAAQTGIVWAQVLPEGWVPFVTLAGTLIATIGPSLKKTK